MSYGMEVTERGESSECKWDGHEMINTDRDVKSGQPSTVGRFKKLRTFIGVVGAVGVLAAVGSVTTATSALAEWSPKGPISLLIAFRAGGGVDTQARLIAAELEKRKGWKIVPTNVTGRVGSLMAKKLKDQPADGSAIGFAVTATFDDVILSSKQPPYAQEDFTYVTTTVKSQLGIVALTSKGWKNWNDFIAEAKTRTIRVGVLGGQHKDVNFLIQKKFGVKLNSVQLRGGRAVMNALTAGDIDIGYVAGIQAKQVRAGTMINLASGLPTRLKVSPDAPTLNELGLGIPDLGAYFLVAAPKGLPREARDTLAKAIGEIIQDPKTKVSEFIGRAFGGPTIVTGKDLDAVLAKRMAEAKKLIEAVR